MLARLNGVLGGVLAGESFVLSQSFFFGGVAGQPPIEVELVEGRWLLDEAHDLEAVAIGKMVSKSKAGRTEKKPGSIDGSAELFSLAYGIKQRGGTLAEFKARIRDYPEAARHVHSQPDSERAVLRAWENAPEGQAPAELFDDLTVDDDVLGPPPKPDSRSTLRRLTMAELLEEPLLFDFVENVLYDGLISTVIGRNSVGKTFYVLDIAMHVALGRNWRGHAVAQRNVLYIALEGASGIRQRVEAWCRHHNADPTTVPFAVMAGALNLRSGDKITLQDVLSFARELNAGLIIIETLARTMPGGKESTSADMGLIIGAITALRDRTGAHVLLVHHMGKDETKGSRGWSGLADAIDTEITVSRGENAVRVARLNKQRDGRDGITWGFTLRTVDLGYATARGKPVTSCVPIPCVVKTGSEKLPRAQAAVMAILSKMADVSQEGVREDEFRDACIEARTVCESENRDSRVTAVRRAIQKLIDIGLLSIRDDRVFPQDVGAEKFEDES